MLQIQQLAKAWQLTEEEEKPNPVTQRVKIIMVSLCIFCRYLVLGILMDWKHIAFIS